MRPTAPRRAFLIDLVVAAIGMTIAGSVSGAHAQPAYPSTATVIARIITVLPDERRLVTDSGIFLAAGDVALEALRANQMIAVVVSAARMVTSVTTAAGGPTVTLDLMGGLQRTVTGRVVEVDRTIHRLMLDNGEVYALPPTMPLAADIAGKLATLSVADLPVALAVFPAAPGGR